MELTRRAFLGCLIGGLGFGLGLGVVGPLPGRAARTRDFLRTGRLWLLPTQPLTAQTERAYHRVATDAAFAGFDAVAVLATPPTFGLYDEAFRQRVVDLAARAVRPVLYASFTVGEEGWETSHNQAFARQLGTSFHPERNLARERWWAEMRLVRRGLWGLTIEALTRPPTEEELRGYVVAFARAARAEGQGAALWYTAHWERFRPAGALVEPVLPDVLPELEALVWMDTRSLLEEQGREGRSAPPPGASGPLQGEDRPPDRAYGTEPLRSGPGSCLPSLGRRASFTSHCMSPCRSWKPRSGRRSTRN